MQTENKELILLTTDVKRLVSDCRKTDEGRLKQATVIGTKLCKMKEIGGFKRGSFDEYVKDNFGIKKTQRCEIMKLHTERGKIPKVREWADKHDLPNATATDVCKLLREFDLRDKRTGEPRTKARKTTLELPETEKSEITALHATWTDRQSPPKVADQAELSLYRMATARKLLIGRLLKQLGLELPHASAEPTVGPLTFTPSEGPEVSEDSTKPESDHTVLSPSVVPSIADLGPSNEQAHPLVLSGQPDLFADGTKPVSDDTTSAPSVVPSITDVDSSIEPTPIPALSDKPELPEDETSDHTAPAPSVVPSIADLDAREPEWTPIGWKDKKTGQDISEKRERDALAMVYKAREQTLQPDTISRKLAKIGIKLPPTEVEKFMSTKKS